MKHLKSALIWVATAVLIILSGQIALAQTSASGDKKSFSKEIVGLWRTESGAVYRFSRESGDVIATFHQPSAGQSASGIKPGDLAFKGNLLGAVLVGIFQQRLPLPQKESCPGAWLNSSTLILQISESFDAMTGAVLLTHYSDSCTPDDRLLENLVFRPIRADETPTQVSPPHISKPRYTSGG